MPCVQHSILYLYLILIISNNTIISFHIVFSRAISRSHHTPEVDIRFQIDGDNVCGSSTFSQLGVENGGIISWVLGQHGGSDTSDQDTLIPPEKKEFFLKWADLYYATMKDRNLIYDQLDQLKADKSEKMAEADSNVNDEADDKFKPVFKECNELYETRKRLLEGTGQADGLDKVLDTLATCKSEAHWGIVKRKEEYIESERANKRRRISEEISSKEEDLGMFDETITTLRSRITCHLGVGANFEKTMAALHQEVRFLIFFVSIYHIW